MAMVRWFVVGLSFLLCTASLRADEKYALREKADVGRQAQYTLDLQLKGAVNVTSGAKTIKLDLAAQAQHRFHERTLNVDEQNQATRVARHYELAEARVTVHGNNTKRTLRPDRRLLVAQNVLGKTVTYSPAGPLTREELELTADHLDVLAIQGVLPTNEVASGDSWDIPPAVVQALVGYDGLVQHDWRGNCTVAQGTAVIAVSGQAIGITRGAEVTTQVEARIEFDVKEHRWTLVTWKQKQDRRQGPIDPAAQTESTIVVHRRFDLASPTLADDVVASIPASPTDAQLFLTFKDARTGGEFLIERGWHVVAQTEQYAVLRLLERGELIGQLNVTPVARAQAGQHLSPDDLKQHVQSVPGFTIDQLVQSGEVPGEQGYWIYRMSVAGRAGDLVMLQNFYAIAGPQGQQFILTFATEMANVDRLGNKDLAIVGTVTFPSPKR